MDEKRDLNDLFVHKSVLKQNTYKATLKAFELINEQAAIAIEQLKVEASEQNENLDLRIESQGMYETEMRFAGDAISIQMHTNVFAFPTEHGIHKIERVRQDHEAGYCGMILIYNFLADSLRFNRYYDAGYLLGRVFINKDGYFFTDGKRQLSFLFPALSKEEFTEKHAEKIIQSAMKQALDFDLLVPPFDMVKEITLQQKIAQQGSTAIKTGKRVGFDYEGKEERK